MAVDFNAWLQDLAKKGGLTDQELATFQGIVSKPSVRQELVDSVERQSDYSRKMQELQRQRDEEDAYAARLLTWEEQTKQRLTELEQQANSYKTQVYSMAQQYNLSPEELQKALTPTTQTAPVAKPAEEPKWVTKQEADNYATAMFKINAKLIGLNQEHIRLYGKPMENIDTFVDEALKAGQPVEQTFRQFYKVETREAELREADIQSRIDKALQEEKLKWAAAGATPFGADPGSMPKGVQSPIFENVEGLDSKAPGDHAAHRARVQDVVAAFNAEQAKSGFPTL